MTRTLELTLAGSDRFPTLVIAGTTGVTSRVDVDSAVAVPCAAVSAIRLAGPRLAQVAEAGRRQALRLGRRLLAPGGRLDVAVGPRAHQYPREELVRAAWNCGFEAYVEFVAGRGVLTVPRREDGPEPLVSILIPAYKDAHFAAALDSALAQSWPRGEIIVGDDSPGDRIAGIVASRRAQVPAGWELHLRPHAEPIGGRANYLDLFAAARGKYVKYLNDDDLLAPDCVARMAGILRDHPAVTLVTSYRRLIDGRGGALPDADFNRPVLADDGLLDGRALATLVLSRMTNLIGEPTTVMFRRADLADNLPHPMSYAGRSARRNGDMSMWTTLLSRGDAAWLAAPLSFFRQHDSQVQKSEVFLREARQAWVELVQDGRETGLVSARYGEVLDRPAGLPGTGSTTVAEAESLYENGDPALADRLLRTILAGRPDHRRARADLACLDWAAGRHETAILGALLSLDPDRPDPTTTENLHHMLAARGRPEEAAALERAIGVVACAQPA
ncbi:MAG: glycosyltransferase [bacterium]|nr:glycosyltransferase [bacterium]